MHGLPAARAASAAVALIMIIGCLAAFSTLPTARAEDPSGDQTRVIILMEGAAALDSIPPAQTEPGSRISDPTAKKIGQERRRVRAEQDQLLTQVEDAGIRTGQRRTLTDLTNGISVTVDRAKIEELATLPGVAAVVPDQQTHAATTDSVPLVGAPEVWETPDSAGKPARGLGVTVAVIDTGIDYTHPDLGGAFGAGQKVVDGRDFVNADDDPIDDNGHGTHIAGIIAASPGSDDNGIDGDGIEGVAPDASLTAYKVLDEYGGGYISDAIAALEEAVAPTNPHRADIVNLSLATDGDGTDPLGQAATKAVQRGAMVFAAAGNSGPGAHTLTSPGNADGVISVGASASGISLPVATMITPAKQRLQTFRAPFTARSNGAPISGDLVDVGEGEVEDYERVGDVAGKVVAYRESLPDDPQYVQLSMLEKAKLAEDRGAIAILAYSGGGGPVLAADQEDMVATESTEVSGLVDLPAQTQAVTDPLRMDRIVVMGLLELQWEDLQARLAEGTVMIEISAEDLTDRIASFSSQGPTEDYLLGPDLVAPGVEILSTLPKSQWEPGVYRLSGTSMASPHAAGAAALLRQLEPDTSAADLAAKLVGSSKGVDGVGPSVQGSGRLDVAAAAKNTLIAEPTALSYGLAELDSTSVSERQTLQLHNTSTKKALVNLAIDKAPGSVGKATVTPALIEIPAGGDAKVTVQVTGKITPGDHDISGWVTATPSGKGAPTTRIPYLLAIRPMIMHATPDPSDGTTTVLIWSPAPLPKPPVLTVQPPKGSAQRVATKLDHGNWYRATVTGSRAGTYRLTTSAATSAGLRLAGQAAFEVVGNRPGQPRWQPVGPNTASGPLFGTEADPGLLAMTQYGKLNPWISTDAGATWKQSAVWAATAGVGDLVIDPDNPDAMWYGLRSSEYGVSLDPTYQGKILRTRNGGKTWQRLDVPDVSILALVGDSEGRVLVAVTPDALLISRNGGNAWTSIGNPAGADLVGVAIGKDDLFLASRNGVWSVPGVVDGDPAAPKLILESGTSALAADSDLVTILTSKDDVLGSRDGGTTWETLFTVPDRNGQSLVMHDGEIMISTTREYQWMGADHGRTWAKIAQPIRGDIEQDFRRTGDSSMLWSSPGAGLFKTDADGLNPRRIGVQGETAYDLAITGAGKDLRLLAGTDHEIYDTSLPTATQVTPKTAEWGLSGKEAYVGTTIQQLEAYAGAPAIVWKIRQNAIGTFFLMRSSDGGDTWEQRGRAVEVPYDLAVGAHDPDQVVVPFAMLGGQGLLVTRNGGESWRKIFYDQRFTTVVTDPADPDRLWLGDRYGLYRSDDFGETAVLVRAGQVSAIQVDRERIVVGGAGLAVSTDGGDSFTTSDSGGLTMQVAALISTPDDPKTLYAGTTRYAVNGIPKNGRGLLKSTDGGRTWLNISGGLQNLNVVSLAISPDGKWLYAGTIQGGVHRLALGK